MMSNDEISRLLGGYATDSLTRAERKALFEAALDDQELFNALSDEEALRDLLADPGSRQAVERALRQPPPAAAARGWLARPWVWGLAGTVAATAVLITVLVWPKSQHPVPAAEVATVQAPVPPPRVADSIAVENRKPPARAKLRKELKQVLPAAKTEPVQQPKPELASAQQKAPGAPVQQAQDTAVGQVVGQVQGPLPAALSGFGPNSIALAKRAVAPTIPFSVVHGSAALIQPGEQVRVRVTPASAGLLTLRQLEGTEWKALVTDLPVEAGRTYTIPDTPIVMDHPRVFQLLLNSSGGPPALAAFTLTPGQPAPVSR